MTSPAPIISIPTDVIASAAASARPESAPPDENGNDDEDGAGSENSQPSQAGDPTVDPDADLASDPDPYFVMTAGTIPEDAKNFLRPFFITDESFLDPVNIQWSRLRATNFTENDVEVAWIANVKGKPNTIAIPGPIEHVPAQSGPGSSIIKLELDLRLGLDHDGLDMFLTLKYPNMDSQDGRKIVQFSPLFTVTSSKDTSLRLSSSYDERKSAVVDLRDGLTVLEGGRELPNGSVCNPLEPTDTSCNRPTFPSPTSATVGGNVSIGGPDGSNSRGGLSTGAKVGIGVGVGIGALLILALVAFLLFRRRQRRRASDHVHSAGAFDISPRGSAVTDYMTDKEISGPRLAESPYSEDGRGSALLASHNHNDFQNDSSARSFAPYSDAAPAAAGATPHAITSDVRVESRTGVRSSTPDHGLPSSVAHLVEDGMTEDQIRILEEEERVLDRAIEQAGHSKK